MEVTAAFYFSRGPRSDSGADPIGLKFSALENLPGIGVLRRGDEILGRSSTKRTQRDRWLEVQFSSAPEFTDELTFKYFILFNGKLLIGEVTHVNTLAGHENRSVMHVAPRSLARFMWEPGGVSLIQQIK
jgi:hypothetical protein